MTTTQQIILKNDINSKLNIAINGVTINVHLSNSNFQAIADYYNTNITPQVDLWKYDVPVEDLKKAILMSEYIALTAVKQNGFAVYHSGVSLDATIPNIRNGFVSIFTSGTSLTNLTAIAKKPATIFENLFVIITAGVGIVPISIYKYAVTPQDIQDAMRS